MVVVYLKNGEKAPLPDANFVRLDTPGDAGTLMLRCYFGNNEVGQFKWDEVAGYAIEVVRVPDISGVTMDAWNARLQG